MQTIFSEDVKSMFKVALALLVILSIASIDAAGAASKRKRGKTQAAIAPTLNQAQPVRPVARTPGPPWAAPGECYTDDGYGRYTQCGIGKE